MLRIECAARAGITAALLATLATTAPLAAQVVQADYPLINDLLDTTGVYGPTSLLGNPTPPNLPSNGVCVNGIYYNNTGGQDVRTPFITTLDTNDFQFEVEFQLAALPSYRAPVVMGGRLWRWLGIYVDSAGLVGLKYNNSNYTWSTTTLTTGQWYAGTVKFEAGVVQLIIDGALVHQANIGALNDGNNKNFTTNDFSNGLSHNGCVRRLRISNDANLGFSRIPTGCNGLTITEGGTPTTGGSVSFTVGGPFSVSGILFGLTPANQPLCAASTSCSLGLVSVAAVPGPTVSLSIPAGVPAGATLLVQGLAVSPGSCSLGGGLDVGTTDTIQVIVQ